jgi:hypothetical protein
MLRTVLEARLLVAVAIAAGVGAYGLRAYPLQGDEVFLAVIEARRPDLFRGLTYGYALLWFSTPFYIASMLTSLFAIRGLPQFSDRPVPRAAAVPHARDAACTVAGPWGSAPSHAPRPCI